MLRRAVEEEEKQKLRPLSEPAELGSSFDPSRRPAISFKAWL